MPLRKCAHCGEREEKEGMVITPIAAFCSFKCAGDYGQEKARKQREKAIQKQARAKKESDKAFRRETKRRKENSKTKSDWAREAQSAVNKYVRLRDRDKGCISCDKPSGWGGQWHASHFYSRGHSSALRFNLWNIHKSCSVCNSHLSGNIGEYRPRLIDKIGQDRYDWLMSNKSELADHSVEYLRRVKVIFNKRCRRMERRIWLDKV